MEDMATTQPQFTHHSVAATPSHSDTCGSGRQAKLLAGEKRQLRRLHRIRTVRRQQGMSLRTVARQMGVGIGEAKALEDESGDLRLSDLYRWHSVLGVPVAELLDEPETPLSRPIMERAQLVRLMKTAMAILEHSTTPQVQRMAQTLVEQLIELMPELKGVGPWHSVGQRRSLDEYGRAAERHISDDILSSCPVDFAE